MRKYKPYLCVTQVLASPEEYDGELGYTVHYSDGWSTEDIFVPKEQFEAHHFPLADPTKISMIDVERMMAHSDIESSTIGDKTTLTLITLPTGFVFTEASSCVDPANYSETVGKEVAFKRVFDKLWSPLGFVLQWARHGLIWKEDVKDEF